MSAIVIFFFKWKTKALELSNLAASELSQEIVPKSEFLRPSDNSDDQSSLGVTR